MEAAGLGLFMMSACLFATFLGHPASPVPRLIDSVFLRRLCMGLAMGLTAVGLIYSPLGQRSGAHLNPAVTLTFVRLGKVAPWDALFYMLAQFAGGLLGMCLAAGCLGQALAHPSVNYVATAPGMAGVGIAFVAEWMMAFGLMSVVLRVSNTAHLAHYTGLCAGILVAIYITIAAPISGMSLNPARTFASALVSHLWTALWVHFVAPPLGMLAAAELYRRQRGVHAVICAKLHHHSRRRCIFRCGYQHSSRLDAAKVTEA
jgi:aquaporin Z